MLFYILTLSLCLTLVASDRVNVTTCPGIPHKCENIELRVSNCTMEDQYCPLYRGVSHEVEWSFEPTSNFTGYTTYKTFGILKDISQPIPYGRSKNACKASGVHNSTTETCSSHKGFRAGTRYTAKVTFPVSQRYPKLQLAVRFCIQDRRTKAMLCCCQVPVEIKDRASTE